MDILDKIAVKIIKEQEMIIGPIAWDEAQQVEGLNVDISKKEVSFSGERKNETIDKLVMQYEKLFGRASVEVCRDAVKDLIVDTPTDQVPSLLR